MTAQLQPGHVRVARARWSPGCCGRCPTPGAAALVRAAQTARRLPRMAREQRPASPRSARWRECWPTGVGAPAVRAGPARPPDRAMGRQGPAAASEGRADPAADADRPRRNGRRPPALARRRGARRAPRARARRPRLRPGGGGLHRRQAARRSSRSTRARRRGTRCSPSSRPHALVLAGEAIDRGLAAMGSFADLISPYLSRPLGRRRRAGRRGRASAAGSTPARATAIRRAGLVHDLGRVAVHPRIWQKPGPLTADEWEQVRLHPYHTERVLSRSPFLSALAAGRRRPPRAPRRIRLSPRRHRRRARLAGSVLAAADAYHAMTEPRPHREPLAPERAAADARRARRAPDASTPTRSRRSSRRPGQRAPRLERPAGLTEREAEVVAMLARGLQTKQVAQALGISVKTADRHIQNAYRKIGVSTRAAATLFAMEHGLVAWGELPIARPGSAVVASSSARTMGRRTEEDDETQTVADQPRSLSRSPRRSPPRGSGAAPRSRRSRRRSASGCCASSARERETRCSSSPPASATPASRRPRWSADAAA